MAEKDVVITYETLFELLRIEKNREELQKLSPTFFDEVLSYLGEKKKAFESKESQETIFASSEKEKTRLELENIRKILKDFYDRRERKIINMAMNKAKSGVFLVNTTSMLPSEKILFDAVSGMLSEFRKNILFRLACGDLPNIDLLPGSVISKLRCDLSVQTQDEQQTAQGIRDAPPSPVHSQFEDDDSGTGGMSFRRAEEPKELKTSHNLSDSGASTKKVRFLAPIEEIVGPDLQIYGPYTEGAVMQLPRELARVLVEKNQAEEVMN
jgi:DNA replication initiation complex subunit (GINS family)